jgi:2',3'-cyclic-nucleotide 2'-phosphodiesterase (5'-nucleotidase family)
MIVVLLHTNDLHGHLTGWVGWDGDLQGQAVGGVDRLASVVCTVRAAYPGSVLLIDAGDLIGDTMIADLTRGKALIAALNHLDYDAMTVGNHEPDFGSGELRKRIAEAKFPVLAANLLERPGGSLLARPSVLRKVGGVAVGLLGLAYGKTACTTAPKNVEGLSFTDPTEAAKRHVSLLRREGADIVIALTHLGLGADIQLARDVEGIDVIVGGHSHNRMIEALRVGDTLIVQAGAHGSDLGRLDLTVERGKIVRHRRDLIPLNHDCVPADPEAVRLVEKLLRPHRKALDERVGTAQGWLVRAQTLAGQEARRRDEESPIDSLFADILRTETKADVALLPGVGYGVAIPPGPVTAAQLRQMVPHDGKVVTMKLSGMAITAILEQAVENCYTADAAVKVGGMIQVGGIEFDYDPNRTKGERVVRVVCAGKPLDPKAMVTVATNTMLARGGHNYREFLGGKNISEGRSQYEVIRDWFGKHSPVECPRPGRIRELRE